MINELFYKGTNVCLNIEHITLSQIFLEVEIKITEFIFQVQISTIYQKTE